jgi:hypothetical protein
MPLPWSGGGVGFRACASIRGNMAGRNYEECLGVVPFDVDEEGRGWIRESEFKREGHGFCECYSGLEKEQKILAAGLVYGMKDYTLNSRRWNAMVMGGKYKS